MTPIQISRKKICFNQLEKMILMISNLLIHQISIAKEICLPCEVSERGRRWERDLIEIRWGSVFNGRQVSPLQTRIF